MGYKERSEYQRRRYARLISRLDADDDETEGQTGGKRGGHGNTRIPYGLCQREGIPIQSGWTPKDAWEALEGKGYNVKETYRSLKKTGKASGAGRTSKSNASYWSGHSQEAAKKIKTLEDSIRGKDTETLYVVDADGNSVLNLSDGSVNTVVVPEKERQKLFNSILTHNHPAGTTFSSDDIETAIKCGLREIRACFSAKDQSSNFRENIKADGEYILVRHYDVDSAIDSWEKGKEFYSDFVKAKQENKLKVDAIYYQSQRTAQDALKCNTMLEHFWDQWLRENAHKYGWYYEKRGGNKQ